VGEGKEMELPEAEERVENGGRSALHPEALANPQHHALPPDLPEGEIGG